MPGREAANGKAPGGVIPTGSGYCLGALCESSVQRPPRGAAGDLAAKTGAFAAILDEQLGRRIDTLGNN